MQAIYQPLSIQDLYFGSAFVTNTFFGTQASSLNASIPQKNGPDFTASLKSINQQPESDNSGSAPQSNILLILGFAILIGTCIYYYYQYQQTIKVENKDR